MFKALLLDLETSPVVAYTWTLRPDVISVEQVIEPSSILCWAAKWRGDDKLLFAKSQERSGPSFKAMIRQMHSLLSEADCIVTYNGLGFDAPRLNNEFVRLGLPPPPPVPHVDLFRTVRSKFDFTSGKLAFVGPYLKIGEKVKHAGWDLWKGCLDGDRESWRLMELYNKQDVLLLEKLYDKLLPWIDGHPNMNLVAETENLVCPNCGSDKVQRRGVFRGATYVYRRYQCSSCGRWSRGRTREKTEPVALLR